MTYPEYIDSLAQEGVTEASVARMMTAARLHIEGRDPRRTVDLELLEAQAAVLMGTESFKQLMRNPDTRRLALEKNTTQLIGSLASIENTRRGEELRTYERPANAIEEDINFLDEVTIALQKPAEDGGPSIADREKKNSAFKKMMDALSDVKDEASMGLGVSADKAKKLTDAARDYNDSNMRVPGGERKAVGFGEAMCVLQRFMPRDKFEDYCRDINQAHPEYPVKAGNYTREWLRGERVAANELSLKNIAGMDRKNPTAEDYATQLAIYNLSAGKKTNLVSASDLERERLKLLQPGSAMNRALQDDDRRQEYEKLMSENKFQTLAKTLDQDSTTHALRIAQGLLNRLAERVDRRRSRKSTAIEYLANVLAVNAFSREVSSSDDVSNGAFRKRAEEIRQDPAFQRLAQRYEADPNFRERVNDDLQTDKTGGMLALEYNREKRPDLARQAQDGPRRRTSMEPQMQQRGDAFKEPQLQENMLRRDGPVLQGP